MVFFLLLATTDLGAANDPPVDPCDDLSPIP